MSDPHFLDRIAHDMKGALTPLQTASWLLRQPNLPLEKQAELAGMVERQVQRLAKMLDEMTDWSRAIGGSLVRHREPCSIAAVVDAACERVSDGPPRCNVQQDLPDLPGDERRLIQMLASIFQFASGRDPLNPATVDVRQDGGQIVIESADRSAEAFSADVFSAPHPEPPNDSLGLRLMIAAAIARGHGGTAESALRPEGGLTLRVSLPIDSGGE